MTLEDLSERECIDLVESRVLGRVAVVVDDVARIFPVNYTVDDGTVVFRTDEGTKLEAAETGAAVTFEVDDADYLYHTGWSVMIVGRLELVSDPDQVGRVQTLPLRAWGRSGQHWIRLRAETVTGRRVNRELTAPSRGASVRR